MIVDSDRARGGGLAGGRPPQVDTIHLVKTKVKHELLGDPEVLLAASSCGYALGAIRIMSWLSGHQRSVV